MDQHTRNMVTYWRTSVADSLIHDGILEAKEYRSFSKQDWENGKLDAELVAKLFADSDAKEEDDFIRILVFPKLYRKLKEDASMVRDEKPQLFSAVALACSLFRKGTLAKAEQPVVPRKLLDPIEPARLVLGKVDDFDKFITEHPIPVEEIDKQWDVVESYCIELFKKVCTSKEVLAKEYIELNDVYCKVVGAGGDMTSHILGLYDLLLADAPSLSLLSKISRTTADPIREPVAFDSMVTAHAGHMSPNHSLALAQRDALSHFLKISDGETLAINGPPGTGKTTLIQGIVATLWVQSALDQREPPVIVAASAGNQAVTNIIKSFGDIEDQAGDPLAGRWLPDVKSYGSYFPSNSRLAEESKKYQTSAFFTKIENVEYCGKAEEFFWSRYKVALPDGPTAGFQEAAEYIRQQMIVDLGIIQMSTVVWGHWVSAVAELKKAGWENHTSIISDLNAQCEDLCKKLILWRQVIKNWADYIKKEQFRYVLFSFIPSVREKRLMLAEAALREYSDDSDLEINCTFKGISDLLQGLVHRTEKDIKSVQNLIQAIQAAVGKVEKSKEDWSVLLNSIKAPEDSDFATFNRIADVTIRYRLFQYATHYWEAMWLKEMKETVLAGDPDTKGSRRMLRKWRRYAKLTPCVVSTFHMLPSHFMAWEGGKKPLYDMIDLLIVDEAGQVTPEICMVSFSLAKKALIVGDTKQIEPVWSVPEIIDRGNILKYGILPNALPESFEKLWEIGCMASNGSLMKMAQMASPYHYDQDLDRGMMLYEHRRCYDEIIAYCNALCYRGKLEPMRGAAKTGGVLPSLAYAHISSRSESPSGGSRYNKTEALAIVEWIKINKTEWESHYGKRIDEIVGVVTPFSAQANHIKYILNKAIPRKPEEKITVGTVHALQGAERPIVIFSPTYSKHDISGSFFFDKGVNMLNVAVSRAKDSFCVIGDMGIFDVRLTSKPSGLLAKMLFADPGSEIIVNQPPLSEEDMLDAT